jgi:hypothetical protein
MEIKQMRRKDKEIVDINEKLKIRPTKTDCWGPSFC